MKVFGKSLPEYLRFQRAVLVLIAAVGLLRLGLSLAGVPNASVKWLSMTAVAIAAVFYYGVRVHTSGFGSYKQLLPLLVIQSALANGIVIVGILMTAATGRENVFTAPEYGGGLSAAAHIGGHLLFGLAIGPLIGWAIGSLVLLVTKKVAPRPAGAVAS